MSPSLPKSDEQHNVESNAESAALSPPEPVSTSPSLSAIAKDLMKLRDWVLLAKTGDNAATPEVLEAIYQQLGVILQKQGLTALEETGQYDEERQQVIDTRVTNDPEKKDVVYSTVRPGYLFGGQLVRPQEVIVYTFDAETSMGR